MNPESTTIKVPKALRDRIAERARRENVTLATAIVHALDEADERAFWLSVAKENASIPDAERAEELSAATFGDDLGDTDDDVLTARDAW